MRLLKKERDRLVALASEPFETAEDFVDAFAKELDRLRGERTHVFACAIVAGVPLAVGPLATRNQAEKAIAKMPVDKGWVVPGWTPDGWEKHLAELDEPPAQYETEQLKSGAFWQKVTQIREGEIDAIVGKNRQDIEIKRLVVT